MTRIFAFDGVMEDHTNEEDFWTTCINSHAWRWSDEDILTTCINGREWTQVTRISRLLVLIAANKH